MGIEELMVRTKSLVMADEKLIALPLTIEIKLRP